MDKKQSIGFIGLGNMGSALLLSLLKNDFNFFDVFYVYDVVKEKVKKFTDYEGIQACSSIQELVNKSDYLLFAIKPQIMTNLLNEIKNYSLQGKKIISIAAGLQISFYRDFLGHDCFITRVMPNTPYLVGEGAAGITVDPGLDLESVKIIKNIFEMNGKVILCEEKYLDVVTGLSGSGPAYIFMIIEALSDGAVKMGLPRDQAYILTAQTVLGAAKMVLDTKQHPGILKDMVTSPGGTTIEAISILERGGLRSVLMDAVEAATKKSASFHS